MDVYGLGLLLSLCHCDTLQQPVPAPGPRAREDRMRDARDGNTSCDNRMHRDD